MEGISLRISMGYKVAREIPSALAVSAGVRMSLIGSRVWEISSGSNASTYVSVLCRHVVCDDAQLEALGLSDVPVADALLLQLAFEPDHEPDEEVRAIILER